MPPREGEGANGFHRKLTVVQKSEYRRIIWRRRPKPLPDWRTRLQQAEDEVAAAITDMRLGIAGRGPIKRHRLTSEKHE